MGSLTDHFYECDKWGDHNLTPSWRHHKVKSDDFPLVVKRHRA